MRIDNENKVVWCSEVILDWYNSYHDGKLLCAKNWMIHDISRIGFGYGLENCDGTELPLEEWKGLNKYEGKKSLILAVMDDYKFKLEEPKKYYWRKKEEHLAWFEERGNSDRIGYIYLNLCKKSKELSVENRNESSAYKTKFTESEVRELLNQDFDKFEKVEIDE